MKVWDSEESSWRARGKHVSWNNLRNVTASNRRLLEDEPHTDGGPHGPVALPRRQDVVFDEHVQNSQNSCHAWWRMHKHQVWTSGVSPVNLAQNFRLFLSIYIHKFIYIPYIYILDSSGSVYYASDVSLHVQNRNVAAWEWGQSDWFVSQFAIIFRLRWHWYALLQAHYERIV